MECPACHSLGALRGFGCPGFKPVVLQCDVCKGSGKVDEKTMRRIRLGAQLRQDRLDQNLTLRAFCKMYGIDPVERSKVERGVK